ncbi:MAG TPA: response regulator [Bryobacteraceae bacterium]|nr:response regulator [Bryobacteraceae bacterium]
MSAPILLVEDELACSATLRIAFEAAGVPSLEHTATAEQALAILRERPVSVLITDIDLPSMNGLELIQKLRAEPRFRALPIIVTSAAADPTTRERALELGATAFFGKPYSPIAIRQKIEELMRDTTD